MIVESCFPPFVESWPEAELDYEGLTGRVLKSPAGLTIFMAADRDVVVPRHRHGAQWGIVLAGSMDLDIAGQQEHYTVGQSHYIPAGVDHEATIYAGWRGMYVFDRSHSTDSYMKAQRA